MRRPNIDEKLVHLVRDRWLSLWNDRSPDGVQETAALWTKAVIDSILKSGADIISKELLIAEQGLHERGLGADYVDALVTVTDASLADTFLLVTATGAQRAHAVQIVLAYEADQKLNEGEALDA